VSDEKVISVLMGHDRIADHKSVGTEIVGGWHRLLATCAAKPQEVSGVLETLLPVAPRHRLQATHATQRYSLFSNFSIDCSDFAVSSRGSLPMCMVPNERSISSVAV
jgi:hypothetical protein